MQTLIASLFTLLYWLAAGEFTVVRSRPAPVTLGATGREETQDTYETTVPDDAISSLFSASPKDELVDLQKSTAAEIEMLDERIFCYEEMVRNRAQRLHEIHRARNITTNINEPFLLDPDLTTHRLSRNLRDMNTKLSDLRERRKLLQGFALDINVNCEPGQNNDTSADVCNVATNTAIATTLSGKDETEGNASSEEHVPITSSQPNGTRNPNPTRSLEAVAKANEAKPKLRPLRTATKARAPQQGTKNKRLSLELENKRRSLELTRRAVVPNNWPVTPTQTTPMVGPQPHRAPLFSVDAEDLAHRLALLNPVLVQKKEEAVVADEQPKSNEVRDEEDVQSAMEVASPIETPATPEPSARPVVDNDATAPEHTAKPSTVGVMPDSPSSSTHSDATTSDALPNLSTDHLDDSDSLFDLSVSDDSVDSNILDTAVKPPFAQSKSLNFCTPAKTRPSVLSFPNRFMSPHDLDLGKGQKGSRTPLAMKTINSGK